MPKGRARFAAVLAGSATVFYFVVQLIFGADAGEAVVRSLIFAVVIFLVSLAIDWEKRAKPKPQNEPTTELPPDQPSQ
jgi:multisubunit Na+/H+ antiporter MnhB subunit